jgi:PEP-CTERM motif-containing protein
MKSWRKWRGVKLAAAALGGLLIAGSAHAAVMYQYVSDQPTYRAGPNQVINVLVYLKETLTSGSNSVIAGDDGLYSGGMDLVRSATGLPTNPSTITGVTFNKADFGPGANTFNSPVPSGDTYFFEALDNSFLHGVAVGNTGNGASPSVPGEIYLGSYQITTGSSAGTTNFNLRRIQGASGNTLTNIGRDLDQNDPQYTGVGSTTSPISVIVDVPEPASFGLLIGVGALGLVRRRRI